ncbi:MAG: DUF1003 domain-containing protein [Ilumatobacteraceae bacterium]
MPHADTCPACGHELSMFEEDDDMSPGERLATRIADLVASWWFAGTLLALIGIWVVVNVVARPFDPYPVIIFAVISAVLASVAALQGPLILLTQRRAASRDRDRDREALTVAVHAESDIHRLEGKLDGLAAALDRRD